MAHNVEAFLKSTRRINNWVKCLVALSKVPSTFPFLTFARRDKQISVVYTKTRGMSSWERVSGKLRGEGSEGWS